MGTLSSCGAPAPADNAPPFALSGSTPDAIFFSHCDRILQAWLRHGTVSTNLLRYVSVVVLIFWKKNGSINSATCCYLLPSLRSWNERKWALPGLADRGGAIQMQDWGRGWFADAHLNQDSFPSALGLSRLIKRSLT